jgi:3-deoxy-D-manno-octulosonic-acid transferase
MSWDWAVWGALAVGGLATLGALALLVVRVLQAWRDFKRMRRHLLKELDAVAAAGEAAADKAEALGETEELQASVGRLRRSLAQLALLREAIDDARTPVRLAAAFAPRK